MSRPSTRSKNKRPKSGEGDDSSSEILRFALLMFQDYDNLLYVSPYLTCVSMFVVL